MATAFVTGATGFLGYALCLDLVEAGYEVRALTRSGALPAGLDAQVEAVAGGLADRSVLEEAMRGCELAFHVAADVSMWTARWAQSYRTNVEGTRAVVDAAVGAGVRRLVYTSSGSTIGKPAHAGGGPVTVDEDSAYNFESLSMTYPHTKWLGEREVLGAADRGLEAIVTHPTMILGPWDHKHNLLPLFRAARRGMPFVPRGWRTPCDVRDVARGHRLAAERGRAGRRFVLGGESYPTREVFARIAAEVGGRPPRFTLPDTAMIGLGRALGAIAELTGRPPAVSPEMARQSTYRVHVSSARAERELGYRCRSVDESIRDQAQWYRDEGLL